MKNLFWIFVVGVFMWNCQSSRSYKVTGTVSGAEEGDTVKLAVRLDWGSTILKDLAFTTIKNGKFVFTGCQDTAEFRVLTCVKNGRELCDVEFILENGKIYIAARPDSCDYEIKGTPLNEVWCAFVNGEKALWREYRAAEWGPSISKEEIKRRDADLDKKLEDYQVRFCQENVDNIAGAYIFYENQSHFDAGVRLTLAKQISDGYTPEMAFLKARILNREKTGVNRSFTDIVMNTPDGEQLSVSEIVKANKVTLIDFWASWCGPCRAEMPNVKAIYEKYHSKGLEIVGVSFDFKEEAWKRAIADMNLVWPQISDIKGWRSEGARLYGIDAIPATILIKDGVIVARDLREEALAEKVAELLRE